MLDEVEKCHNNEFIKDFKCNELEEKWCWIINYSFKNMDKEYARELMYRIEPIDLIDTEDVPAIRQPELEKRCEALEKHNDELKKEAAELKKNNSAAQCYLTFWDGGKYENLDHVLNNVYAAREILQGGEKGNTHIIDLFKDWKKNEKQ